MRNPAVRQRNSRRQSCTTPPAATTTPRRTRPGSSGRSTRITPARWAGATSPTTRWSTSTARSSRAAPAASTRPVEGAHTGGFNRDTWGVAMIGDFERCRRRRSSCAHAAGCSAGGWAWTASTPGARSCWRRRAARSPTSRAGPPRRCPTIFTHRDVGNTDCPGNAAYAAMDQIRDIAARFNGPPETADLADTLRGGAIFARVAVDGRHEQPARRTDVTGGGRRRVRPAT